MGPTTWNGSPQEGYRLQEVLRHNCECQRDMAGAIIRGCPAHVAMVMDQRFLDGLLFGCALADRLCAEEFDDRAYPATK